MINRKTLSRKPLKVLKHLAEYETILALLFLQKARMICWEESSIKHLKDSLWKLINVTDLRTRFLWMYVCLCFFLKWVVLFLIEGCGEKDGRHDGTQDGVADVIMRRCLQSGRWGTLWLSCGSCSYQVICHPLVFLCDCNRILPRDHLEFANLMFIEPGIIVIADE